MRKPIEVIAHYGADGEIQPLRFRYENEEHRLVRVIIDRIISKNEVSYVGIEAFVFLCRATEEEQRHMFELRYEVRSHSWTLQDIIY